LGQQWRDASELRASSPGIKDAWTRHPGRSVRQGRHHREGFHGGDCDPASVNTALEQVTETLGPVGVLQHGLLPQKDFVRSMLENTPADFVGPIEFSIYVPVAAVHHRSLLR
jgi:hypothetical protein